MRKEVKLDLATRLINNGPVVLISSMKGLRSNITPVAWHMPISKKPPMIALEIGQKHFIYECIVETGDFVVNIPSKHFVEEIVKCGSCSGRDVDKFKECNFTEEPPKVVASPRIKEAMAVLECELVKDKHLMEIYNIVVGEIKYAEVEEKAFGEHWLFKDDQAKTIQHLGDKTFCYPESDVVDLREK